MDTVMKSMFEEEEEQEHRGLMLFGRDLSKIPCFRESFLYGILSGVGIGLGAFVKTSKPWKSQHIGMSGFALTTMLYWSFCRYRWSQQRFDAELMQEALKDKMLYEGTAVERSMKEKGILKTV